MKKIKTISTKNKMVANILRLLFSDDPVNRETGALAASGLGLVEPLYRHLIRGIEDLRRRIPSLYKAKVPPERLHKSRDIIMNYRNGLLSLFAVMPAEYRSRRLQINEFVKNITFRYVSMQYRETPRNTGALVGSMNGIKIVYGF